MHFIAIKLTNKLDSAGIPVHGVSIGRVNDKKTWRIDFKDEASLAQRSYAKQILDDYDDTKIPDPVSEFDQLKARIKELEDKQNDRT